MSQITNVWTAGTTYPPGSTVRPTSPTGAKAAKITTTGANDGFELGNLTDWTSSGLWAVVNTLPYQGTYSAKLPAGSGTQTLRGLQAATGPGNAGQIVTAWCYVNLTTNASLASAACTLSLYDNTHTLIATLTGTAASPTGVSGWVRLTCSASVLIGTAYIAVGVTASSVAADVYVDSFGWDLLVNPYDNPQLFYAIQTGTGKSGQIEPDWTQTPPINDGTVIWTNQPPTEIVWLAEPLLKSGSSEPTWPTVVGQVVHDPLSGTPGMEWQAQTPQITDTNCPNSKIVVMATSKIYAGNVDIVNFSATLNAMDWTSEADAGFIGTGLQQNGDNPVAAMGLYRSMLCVFNANGFQMWQIDEDPANMQLLSSKKLGSIYHRALVEMNDDLFFLSSVGIRSVGISGGSGNLQSGDVGMPIDPIVADAIAYLRANPTVDPIGIDYVGAGQYWLAIPGWTPSAGLFAANPATLPGSVAYNKSDYDTGTNVLVYTMTRTGEVGAWTRYLFPFSIEAFCIGSDQRLYIKSGDHVIQVDPATLSDYVAASGATTYFPCMVQWQWLDMGQPGQLKKIFGFDIVTDQASATIDVSFGYDQSSTSTFTSEVELSTGDTIPGQIIPMPMMAASLSPRVRFSSADDWKLHQLNVYVSDQRMTS